MENWIKEYLEVMQSRNGMDDESQSQLARRIEKVVKAVEAATRKRVREVKISQHGGVNTINTIMDDERWMLENSRLFEESNSVAGFNDLNKLQESQEALQEAQKEIGKLIQRLHDMQKAEKTAQRRAEEAEKQVAKLREVDEKRQCEINNFRSLVSKKEEKATKLEKRIAKALEERVASEEALRVALRKAQAERDATSKKKSAKIENLQKGNNELQKKINEINTSRENEQALNAAAMKSLEEKLVAKMTVEKEDHTANVKIMEGKYGELTIKVEELEKDLQRKCEVIEVLQQTTEEKENMDTTKANEVDSEKLNAVSDDTQKVGETEALDEVDEPVIKCMEKEFDKALDDSAADSAADSDDVGSEYAIHSRPSNVLNVKYDLRWTDENLKYLKGQSVRWQKVFCFEDQMFVMNLQDGIVYIDLWGVPCDMEQSSFAAFEDLLSNDDSSDEG